MPTTSPTAASPLRLPSTFNLLIETWCQEAALALRIVLLAAAFLTLATSQRAAAQGAALELRMQDANAYSGPQPISTGDLSTGTPCRFGAASGFCDAATSGASDICAPRVFVQPFPAYIPSDLAPCHGTAPTLRFVDISSVQDGNARLEGWLARATESATGSYASDGRIVHGAVRRGADVFQAYIRCSLDEAARPLTDDPMCTPVAILRNGVWQLLAVIAASRGSTISTGDAQVVTLSSAHDVPSSAILNALQARLGARRYDVRINTGAFMQAILGDSVGAYPDHETIELILAVETQALLGADGLPNTWRQTYRLIVREHRAPRSDGPWTPVVGDRLDATESLLRSDLSTSIRSLCPAIRWSGHDAFCN